VENTPFPLAFRLHFYLNPESGILTPERLSGTKSAILFVNAICMKFRSIWPVF